jgi:cytochrome c
MDRVLSFSIGIVIAIGATTAQAGDAAHGKALFTANCSVCHNADKDGANKIGPNLYGVIGRPAGTHPGFNYSSVMKSAGLAWTPDKLAAYLAGPQKMLPGVKMTFAGFGNPSDAQDVISYLGTLKDGGQPPARTAAE